MRIVFESNTPLPVKTYGGTERIQFWHMKELARLGHEVTLIGHPDSQVSELGIKLIPKKKFDDSWIELIPKETEIVHFQYNWNRDIGFPYIVTIHGNGQPGEVFSQNSVFVSRKHAENHNSLSYIHNALDFSEYPFQPKEKNDWEEFLFLAKASWKVKNLRDCVKACKSTKKTLHVAGGRHWWPSRYIKNHGFIGGDEKLALLRSVDALLFPVRWHEPFGIAIIEAMSQGIPVIGSPYGSLPELISEKAGKICQNYRELEATLSTPMDFDPEKIRTYAETYFSITSYSQKYVDLYEKVIAGESLNDASPSLIFGKKPEELLDF